MPPKLDFSRPVSSALRTLCPPSLLDALPGVAGLLDHDAKWYSVSSTWDSLLSRASRPEWLRDALLGKPFLDLFADERQRSVLRKVIASLVDGRLEQHAQTLEFGSGTRMLQVELILRPLHTGKEFAGMLVQVQDVTRYHLNRIALLDRERRMRELQEKTEAQATDYTETVTRRTLEHAKEVTDLHEELERLSKEHEAQLAQISKSDNAAARQHTQQQAQRAQEIATLTTRMTTVFHEEPQDFGMGFCKLFKEISGCYFTVLYEHSSDEQKFVLCDHFDAPEIFQAAVEQGSVRMAEDEGPCGLAAAKGERVKFDHLLQNKAYARWVHLARDNGYNCLWALPLYRDKTIFGVIQLYYREQDVDLTPEQQASYTALARAAVPLVQASQELAATALLAKVSLQDDHEAENWRRIIGEIAEEYGRLLTGMLGHSTLVAAEIGETHAAREELRAIERAARTAAKLTRRLASLSGQSENYVVVELGVYVQNYLKQRKSKSQDAEEVVVPAAPCKVRAEVTALEVILDGIREYVWRTMPKDTRPLWTLVREDHAVLLTLLFDGAPPPSSGNGNKKSAYREPFDFLLSREAARALGGKIEINADDGHTVIALTLPLAEEEERIKAKG